jgi:dTDP-glucose 4,6-dehydratase
MGSHLTEALVHLGANVHAFVRATSSGALNNIWHLRDRLRVDFADLTDRTSIDSLVKELCKAPDRPYVSTWARRRTAASRGTGRPGR